MRSIFAVLSLAASAFAYSVTSPGGTQGWTIDGSNTVTWQRVDTDRLNFTLLLTNEKQQGNQVLNAFVDGTLGSLAANPPSGGWPTGSGFRLNFVQDPNHLDTILAQSSEFSITQPTSSLASTVSRPLQTTVPLTTPTAASNTAGGTQNADNLNPTNSVTDTNPNTPNAAGRLASRNTQSGVVLVVAALGALLV